MIVPTVPTVVWPSCSSRISKWNIGLDRNSSLRDPLDVLRNLLFIRTMA